MRQARRPRYRFPHFFAKFGGTITEADFTELGYFSDPIFLTSIGSELRDLRKAAK